MKKFLLAVATDLREGMSSDHRAQRMEYAARRLEALATFNGPVTDWELTNATANYAALGGECSLWGKRATDMTPRELLAFVGHLSTQRENSNAKST